MFAFPNKGTKLYQNIQNRYVGKYHHYSLYMLIKLVFTNINET